MVTSIYNLPPYIHIAPTRLQASFDTSKAQKTSPDDQVVTAPSQIQTKLLGANALTIDKAQAWVSSADAAISALREHVQNINRNRAALDFLSIASISEVKGAIVNKNSTLNSNPDVNSLEKDSSNELKELFKQTPVKATALTPEQLAEKLRKVQIWLSKHNISSALSEVDNFKTLFSIEGNVVDEKEDGQLQVGHFTITHQEDNLTIRLGSYQGLRAHDGDTDITPFITRISRPETSAQTVAYAESSATSLLNRINISA